MTGRLPVNHGIIANSFYDDELDSEFDFKKDSSGEGDKKWWKSEPVSYAMFFIIAKTI